MYATRYMSRVIHNKAEKKVYKIKFIYKKKGNSWGLLFFMFENITTFAYTRTHTHTHLKNASFNNKVYTYHLWSSFFTILLCYECWCFQLLLLYFYLPIEKKKDYKYLITFLHYLPIFFSSSFPISLSLSYSLLSHSFAFFLFGICWVFPRRTIFHLNAFIWAYACLYLYEAKHVLSTPSNQFSLYFSNISNTMSVEI